MITTVLKRGGRSSRVRVREDVTMKQNLRENEVKDGTLLTLKMGEGP